MYTDTKTGLNIEQVPILDYFQDASSRIQSTGQNMIARWRKGEKGIASWMAIPMIAALGILGYLFFAFALPAIGAAVATVLYYAIVGGSIITALAFSGVIIKYFRRWVRRAHEKYIQQDPFEEPEAEKQRMYAMKDNFLREKTTIKKLGLQYQEAAMQTQEAAEQAQEDFFTQKKLSDKYKAQLADMLEKNPNAKEEDDWQALNLKYIDAVSAAERQSLMLEKNKEWTLKNATRANAIKKMDQKLAIGATLMDNKIKDFEVSIQFLKRDFEMANSAAYATSAIKKTLLAKKRWEVGFALDFISNKIAEQTALTIQNFEELKQNTINFDFDSDAAYDKLDKLANKITQGLEKMPDAAKISSVGHKLTAEEKAKSGGLGGIFD